MKKTLPYLFIAIILCVCIQQNISAQQKFALVIGNGNYTSFGSLPNAINDANDITAALQALGFTVDKILDGNRAQMADGIIRLKNRLSVSKSSYGFFYYAGHGLQHNGVNFLIPANANIPSANFLGDTSISVQTMLAELNDAGNELNIVVLDACRDFPASWSRSMNRGLAVVANQPADSIIVYATSAGSVASDGVGRNGLFTSHLLTQLKTPGINVRDIFYRTGAAVSQASNRQQVPAIYSQYFGTAFLGTQPRQTEQQRPVPDNMVRINGGTFTMGSPENEPGRRSNEQQWQVTVSSFYMRKNLVTQKEYQDVMGTNTSFFKGDNLPVDSLTWYEAVEYCNKLSQREGLTPAYTINGTNVTWNVNANGYRLPTEAEWEYACRAGTTTAYNTGAVINDSTGWYDVNSDGRTHPVGFKRANAWGLFDMHGNVYEWCWDWYESQYQSGPLTNPTGASFGTHRVLRGGSWFNEAIFARSANRNWHEPTDRYRHIGIRPVRSAVN
ncbi:MAG: SUMF1/EgtB/PvdO family nonheme iron enzyme [Treponema sp.]|nr:SUMF1/EgtB/PvdO family nonheme iron enzyme [Treponema sp.]